MVWSCGGGAVVLVAEYSATIHSILGLCLYQ